MREGRQRYYAALDHENTAQRLFDGYGSGGNEGSVPRDGAALAPEPGMAAGAEGIYNELGMRVYRAFENLLGNLSEMGRGGGTSPDQARRVLSDSLQPLCHDLEEVRRRLEQQESVLNEIAAGMRRIDRFTLEAFQRLSGRIPMGAPLGSPALPPVGAGSGLEQTVEGRVYEPPRRLAKEETIARSLEAARRLRSQGRKLTLKSVADAAGLKYSQIVYAFGSKDEMLERVQRETMNVASAS